MNRRSLLCLLAVMLSLIIAIGGCASGPQAAPGGGPAAPNPNLVPSIADVKTAQLSDTFAGRPEPLDAANAHDRAVIEKILGWLTTAEVVGGQGPVRGHGPAVLTLQLTDGKVSTVRESGQRDEHLQFDAGDGKLFQLKAPALAKWLNGLYIDDVKLGPLPPPPPSPLRDYTPVRLALSDYRDVVRDLIANPDPAIVAGLRLLGAPVDYGSPPATAGMHYRLILKGPNGADAEVWSVGDGNWRGPDGWLEGMALQQAAERALRTPVRQPGDLEYLLAATRLGVAEEHMSHGQERWNERRQWVVRALRDGGVPASAAPTEPPPLKLRFTVNGNTEVVEVWDEAFRYAGKVYRAEHILQGLGFILSAG